MKQFDVTYTITGGLIITAESEEEVRAIYGDMGWEDLIEEATYIEDAIDSIEEVNIEGEDL